MATKTIIQKVQERKFLAISLFAIAFGIMITNLISQYTAIVFTSLSYIATSGSFLVLALIITVKTRGIGSHGKSWIFFAHY